MMQAPPATEAWLLFRLDGWRLAAALRRPALAAWLGVTLPLALLAGLLWIAGARAVPDVRGAEGAVALGLLVSGPVSFAAYGVLFRGRDDPLLRRLGVPARALYAERAARLLALCLGVAAALLIPLTSAGAALGRPLALLLAASLAAWGAALWALSGAARALAERVPGQGSGWMAMGVWDRELAGAAPLMYAPLAPLLAGAVAGGVTGAAPGAAWARVLAVAAAAVAAAGLGARAHARALPRFAPRVLEMTFTAPPAEGGELHLGRGMARLLPRRAAAVWARDTLVAQRRLGWAMRIVWPVAIVSVVALARWGRDPATQVWVAGAALLALLVQAAAAVALGRLERQGRRWIDRSLGLGLATRLLGRWAWGWGMSLWLTIPLALAWGWWSGAGGGWVWPVIGAGTAVLAATASVAVAGWR